MSWKYMLQYMRVKVECLTVWMHGMVHRRMQRQTSLSLYMPPLF